MGFRKLFLNNFAFPTWACAAGFNNDNNNNINNNNNNAFWIRWNIPSVVYYGLRTGVLWQIDAARGRELSYPLHNERKSFSDAARGRELSYPLHNERKSFSDAARGRELSYPLHNEIKSFSDAASGRERVIHYIMRESFSLMQPVAETELSIT